MFLGNIENEENKNEISPKRGEDIDISPKAEDILSEDDIIVAIGSADDLSNLEDILIRKK